MLGLTKLFFLLSLQYILVQCMIPTLNVHKVDQTLIKKKRQDTLDMCRMFNAEIERLKSPDPFQHLDQARVPNRRKRSLDSLNPALDMEDERRVESIVDKMYDEIQDGKEISYRRKNLEELTTTPAKIDDGNSGRRYDFAPAQLLPPFPTSDGPNLNDYPSPKVNWTKYYKHGIVPYFIDSKTYDTHLADIIMDAFDYFERSTCIRLQRLREKPTDEKSMSDVEWIYITNPSGIKQCVHSNERKKNIGVQMIIFGYDCMSLGEIVHEVMHILGFSHEHTRPDRDQHITIMWQNIKPGYRKYFSLRTDDPLLLIPYDYTSILHYPQRAFSKNGQYTILTPDGSKIGQRDGLSESDVAKVGMIFGNECMERNKHYLETTCPSVMKAKVEEITPTKPDETKEYFKDRLWPSGTVHFTYRDAVEFSTEERENIKAVMGHIEKETCIRFRNVGEILDEEDVYETLKETRNDNNEDNKKKENLLEQSDKSEEKFRERKDHSPYLKYVNKTVETDDDAIDSNALRSKKLNLRKLHHEIPAKGVGKLQRKMRLRTKKEPLPTRRHSSASYTLVRSPTPGCQCPEPGKPNGNNVSLVISSGCFNSVNDLLHLFVHVLGLDHQHNMYDRDSYLHVAWENLTAEIKNEMQHKLPPGASVGLPYDYQSVMHYPWLQIKDGVSNIMYPIWNDGWAMGHWQGLSSTDVLKINTIYAEECANRSNDEKEPS